MEQSVKCGRDKGRAENTLAGRLNSENGDASLDAKCKKRAGEVDGWQLQWLVASRTHAQGSSLCSSESSRERFRLPREVVYGG